MRECEYGMVTWWNAVAGFDCSAFHRPIALQFKCCSSYLPMTSFCRLSINAVYVAFAAAAAAAVTGDTRASRTAGNVMRQSAAAAGVKRRGRRWHGDNGHWTRSRAAKRTTTKNNNSDCTPWVKRKTTTTTRPFLVNFGKHPLLYPQIITVKAHQRANLIFRSFVSRDVSLLLRAYLTYVRPVVECNFVVWSHCLKQDIETVERVQRRFTKRLPGFKNLTYTERLKGLKLPGLELRRLYNDLTWCYKILFGYTLTSVATNFSHIVLLCILGVTPTNCSRNAALSAADKLFQWTCH